MLSNLPGDGNKGINTSELSKKLVASKGNITRLLDRMEGESLISRTNSHHDRRIISVHLQEKGSQLFKLLAKEHELWADEVFSVLTTDEQNTLIELTTKVFEQARRIEN